MLIETVVKNKYFEEIENYISDHFYIWDKSCKNFNSEMFIEYVNSSEKIIISFSIEKDEITKSIFDIIIMNNNSSDLFFSSEVLEENIFKLKNTNELKKKILKSLNSRCVKNFLRK